MLTTAVCRRPQQKGLLFCLCLPPFVWSSRRQKSHHIVRLYWPQWEHSFVLWSVCRLQFVPVAPVLKFTFSMRTMMMMIIIITFLIIIIIPYCWPSIIAFLVSSKFNHLPPPFKCICCSRSLGEEVKAKDFCPRGNATSNSNTLRVMLQKCTWKGFCVFLLHKNAHVLSDQARLLMFPRVQLS